MSACFSIVLLCVVSGLLILIIRHYLIHIQMFIYIRFILNQWIISHTKLSYLEYDAHVIYIDSDYRHHASVLRRKLENIDSKPLHLCFKDRDFVLGSPMQDNIMDAIEKSSKVIVLISQDAPHNEWFHYSFNLAIREGKNRGERQFVIPVLTENIDRRTLHYIQQKYLKRAYILNWNDKHFWKKLNFFFPDRIVRDHTAVELEDDTFQMVEEG